MSESKTFVCESYNNRTTYYDIDEKGLIYRPDNDEKIDLVWRDIQYIEDHSGNRIVISLYNTKEVPINYSTNDFPIFLKTICLRLSEIRRDTFRSQKFTLHARYLLHLSIAVLLFVLSLIISLTVSNVLFIMFLTLCIPLGIFFQRQPISLTVDTHGLTFHHVFKESIINYNEISNIEFEVMDNDYGSTLCIVLNLKNQKKIILKKFEDIIIFFIMVHIQLHET